MSAMRTRAILPGALIAGLVTTAALLALVVALGIRGGGPLALGLGDSDGSARLDDVAAPAGESGRAPARLGGTPVVLPGGGVAAPAAGVAPRRAAGAPRVTTQGNRGATRGGLRTPSRQTPAVAPAPTAAAPTTATTTPQVATSTPNPVAVKVRGRGKTKPTSSVPKSRVKTGRPATPVSTPAPGSTPGPAPRSGEAPAVEKQRVAAPTPTPATGLGADDGVLHRVP